VSSLSQWAYFLVCLSRLLHEVDAEQDPRTPSSVLFARKPYLAGEQFALQNLLELAKSRKLFNKLNVHTQLSQLVSQQLEDGGVV
jgi:hypothetical protein